jgi:hypothetical protein
VTVDPTGPDGGLRKLILGETMKLTPLLLAPLANTTRFPVVAPVGTVATTLVAFQLVTGAATPLKKTLPPPCVAPKFVPVIVTVPPTGAAVGDTLAMFGDGKTVNPTPLLAIPFTVTTTFPDVTPVGTTAPMLVTLQLVVTAAIPLNVTLLLPCDAPKFDPLTTTAAVTAAEGGVIFVIPGETGKFTPALLAPLANTTTFPVVAPEGTNATMLVAVHEDTLAGIPVK